MDPDPYPAFFVSAFQDVIKNKFLKSHKTVEMKEFSQFFSLLEGAGAGSGSVQIFTDLNPDPGGPKTFGS